MKVSRRSTKADYWQGVLSQQQESGLTVAAFCRERNISHGSFYQWRNKLQPQQPTDTKQNHLLVPIKLVSSTATKTQQSSIQILTPSGYSLRIDAQLPATDVALLLTAIESAVQRGEA